MTRIEIFGLAVLAILLTVASGAFAQTCQTINGITYCNGSNGSNYTGQTINGTTYWNGTTRGANGFSETWRKTCQTINGITYCN